MNTNIKLSSLFLTATAFLYSCGNSNNNPSQSSPSEKIVPVTTTVVSEEIVTGRRNYPASAVALNETELRAEVSGYINQIYVADGASVTKGQKLYEIDHVRYTAALNQAKADLEIAKSNYSRIEKDLSRYQTLAEQDAIAKQTLDYAETDLGNQRAQVQAAEAALTTAQTNLDRSIIRAPFSGTVGISLVRTGALVTAGSTLLNTISSTNPIAVEFQINEKEIEQILELQKNRTTSAIQVVLPDGSIYTESGYISTVDRAVDRNTGTLKVRATFDNQQGKLRAGMNLTLYISTKSLQEELVIPHRAIVEQLGVYNVYTVNDSSKAVFQPVKLGSSFEDKIIILDGLKQGDRVIVDGTTNVVDGDKVSEKND